MPKEVRGVALSAVQKTQVLAALALLAAESVNAEYSDWNGGRCDLVVANADDGYGRHVIEIALRRGLVVLALRKDATVECHAQSCIDGVVSDADLATEMRRVMDIEAGPHGQSVNGDVRETANDGSSVVPDSAVNELLPCRIAFDPALAGRDLYCRLGQRKIFLSPERGRVLTRTWSDQLSASEHFCGPGWTVRALAKGELERREIEVSSSLDAFYLGATLRGASLLPRFPGRKVALKDWPDLGTAADQGLALRIAGALSRRSFDPVDLVAQVGGTPSEISACLWAYAASGLLNYEGVVASESSVATTPGRALANSLLAKLARHFGFARST